MHFSDFEVDPSVQGKCTKVVLCDDLVRDEVEGQTHVLVAVRGRIIIEIFNVGNKELGTRSGECAI